MEIKEFKFDNDGITIGVDTPQEIDSFVFDAEGITVKYEAPAVVVPEISEIVIKETEEGEAVATIGGETTTYTGSVDNAVDSIYLNITATPEDAVVSIKNNDVDATSPVALSVGENVIVVKATLDEQTSDTYTITITRAEQTEESQDQEQQ